MIEYDLGDVCPQYIRDKCNITEMICKCSTCNTEAKILCIHCPSKIINLPECKKLMNRFIAAYI
jgi:hypothetical protein